MTSSLRRLPLVPSASLRHVENEHCYDQLVVGIAICMEHVAESTLARPVRRSLEVAMCLGTCINACTYCCRFRTAIEHQDYCLAVPPCGVAQELVDRLSKGLRTLSEFALDNKDIAFAPAQ